MAKYETLLNLKTKIREQCDMVNSEYVSDEELTRYINSSCCELYGLLATAYGEDYYFEETTVVVPAGEDKVDLPDNFWKLYKVEIANGTNRKTTLRQFQSNDKNRFSYSANVFRYRVRGNKIYLDKAPNSDLTLYLEILPVYEDMVEDTDEFDFINGYAEYVIADVCLKMLAKQQDDLTYFIGKKNEQLDRITKEKIARNMAEPQIMIGFNEFDSDDDGWYY